MKFFDVDLFVDEISDKCETAALVYFHLWYQIINVLPRNYYPGSTTQKKLLRKNYLENAIKKTAKIRGLNDD